MRLLEAKHRQVTTSVEMYDVLIIIRYKFQYKNPGKSTAKSIESFSSTTLYWSRPFCR